MSNTLTVRDAAHLLGLSRQRVFQLIRSGRLPARVQTVSRQTYLIAREDLERFAAAPKPKGGRVKQS